MLPSIKRGRLTVAINGSELGFIVGTAATHATPRKKAKTFDIIVSELRKWSAVQGRLAGR